MKLSNCGEPYHSVVLVFIQVSVQHVDQKDLARRGEERKEVFGVLVVVLDIIEEVLRSCFEVLPCVYLLYIFLVFRSKQSLSSRLAVVYMDLRDKPCR